MRTLESPTELAEFWGGALVPTMGALHEGHASLIRTARATGRPVLLTIFVNPTQFGPSEDLAKYPRTLAADLALAAAAGADAVFVPSVEAIYPKGVESALHEADSLALPAVAREPRLEDACRPSHFAGVAQVVATLFDLCRPQLAVFGEKDFQQLRVITELVRASPNRWPGLTIVPSATIREADGLAMSSRNRYLSTAQRERALAIHRALLAAQSILHGLRAPTQSAIAEAAAIAGAEAAMRTALAEADCAVQYAAVRSAATLASPTSAAPLRALIAATVDGIRLIDNLEVWTPQHAR